MRVRVRNGGIVRQLSDPRRTEALKKAIPARYDVPGMDVLKPLFSFAGGGVVIDIGVDFNKNLTWTGGSVGTWPRPVLS